MLKQSAFYPTQSKGRVAFKRQQIGAMLFPEVLHTNPTSPAFTSNYIKDSFHVNIHIGIALGAFNIIKEFELTQPLIGYSEGGFRREWSETSKINELSIVEQVQCLQWCRKLYN